MLTYIINQAIPETPLQTGIVVKELSKRYFHYENYSFYLINKEQTGTPEERSSKEKPATGPEGINILVRQACRRE
ncbi:hypothetical protein CEXT_349931 [Caerostris extrusa]|uniref:Uncharacterized protein n=1 Tax=Caerostris extrusa TaxID=172846 RepID=A0AAV4MUX7_CAEEX|nr:hypothetical protein CEXT_349931 [Caerostris extrusa]